MLEYLSLTANAVRGGLLTGELYRHTEEALQELVGYRLLTILQARDDRLYRVHTSDLVSYPTGGCKVVSADSWLKTMLEQGLPVISPDLPTVRQRFPDHEVIESLGCGSVLNVPVTCPTGTLGSVNLLHEANWFTSEHGQIARLFATQLAVAWLARALLPGRTGPTSAAGGFGHLPRP